MQWLTLHPQPMFLLVFMNWCRERQGHSFDVVDVNQLLLSSLVTEVISGTTAWMTTM